ncbi:MAG TPA: PEP_CTERM-anchored TLD domain-containing protein [Lacunisphaera sp.]|nr:PEP_CTERM-anchored TLD domain-containing protein [Lacunisphaera sp.]
MKFPPTRLFAAVGVAASLLLVPALKANLLSSANETQLESWLGQGDLDFTNIFTKVLGDGQNATNFHGAVDNKGPTFVLMSVYGDGGVASRPDLPSQIIGGYDPLSWSTNGLDMSDAGQTGFIFNLTSSEFRAQIGGGTYNHFAWGPTFGHLGDITTYFGLENGYASNGSYFSGGTNDSITLGSGLGTSSYFIASLEVYTFSPVPSSNVPDAAGTLGLLGATLLALAALRRQVV